MKSENKHPQVSVCIPAYNHAAYIRETVESALAQNFESFEVVVSDNHSNDGTDKVLEEFNDERLRVIKPPTHLGMMGANWNFCISHARGEYIVLLSSDDKLAPNFLKEQSEILDKFPEVAFAFCATWKINENSRVVGLHKSLFRSREISKLKAYMWYLDGPKNTLVSTLFRKSLYLKVGGFNEKHRIGLDWEFWIELLRHGNAYYNEYPLAYYRLIRGKHSICLRQNEEMFEIFEAAVRYCPSNLKSKVDARYNKIKKRLLRRAVAAAAQIRSKHLNDSNDLLSLCGQYGKNSAEIRLRIRLARLSWYKHTSLFYQKTRNGAKIVIKQLVWLIRN